MVLVPHSKYSLIYSIFLPIASLHFPRNFDICMLRTADMIILLDKIFF